MVGINKIMKQAQKMQQEVAKIQEELAKREIETTAGGGAIKIVMTGDKKLKKIQIDPDLLEKENKDMLEDMIVAGINQSLQQVEEMASKEMSQVSRGMGIPGVM